MFTGLVETLGTVTSVEEAEGARRLTLRGVGRRDGLALGDSVSVNGCCLTAVALDEETFTADVMAESLRRTTLGELAVGHPVNLERAMLADGRFGGHMVQGHVDATATVVERAPTPRWDVVTLEVPAEVARYVVAKGSITLDGVSLTVVDAPPKEGGALTVSLIPETLRRTTWGQRAVGARVNVEVDVLAKYVERLLAPQGAAS